jgi:penicillin-binding protein-related factor A (putative recombinase)
MRDEAEFNSFLAKELKKHHANVVTVKICDRFKIGLSDFIMWMNGTSICLECKRAVTGNKKGKLLTHAFTPPQKHFLTKITHTKNLAYGLVSVEEEKVMYLLPLEAISEDGNVTKTDLVLKAKPFDRTSQGVKEFIAYLEEVTSGRC